MSRKGKNIDISSENFLMQIAEHMSAAEVKASLIMSDIASGITEYQMNHSLDQKQMAELLGVSQPMISKYESGSYNYTIKSLCKLAEQMNFEINLQFKNTQELPQMITSTSSEWKINPTVSLKKLAKGSSIRYKKMDEILDKEKYSVA